MLAAVAEDLAICWSAFFL